MKYIGSVFHIKHLIMPEPTKTLDYVMPDPIGHPTMDKKSLHIFAKIT